MDQRDIWREEFSRHWDQIPDEWKVIWVGGKAGGAGKGREGVPSVPAWRVSCAGSWNGQSV